MALIDMVERLITEKGRSVTHVVKSTTPLNSATPWMGNAATEVTNTVDAVFIDFDQEEIDGTTIRLGMKKVFVAGSEANLEQGHIIRDGSTDYRITHVSIVQPGSTRYLYELVVEQ